MTLFYIIAAIGLLALLVMVWLALPMSAAEQAIEQIDADEEVLGDQVDIRRFYQRWEDRV